MNALLKNLVLNKIIYSINNQNNIQNRKLEPLLTSNTH